MKIYAKSTRKKLLYKFFCENLCFAIAISVGKRGKGEKLHRKQRKRKN